MKLIDDDGLYVQKRDILSIQSIYGLFPTNLMDKVFPENFDKKQFNLNESIFINDPIDVKMINSFGWMVKFVCSMSLSVEELKEMIAIKNERSNELHVMVMNAPNGVNSEDYISEIKSIDYEIQEIKDVILEKEKHIKLNHSEEDLKR